jgi:signal peptidase I
MARFDGRVHEGIAGDMDQLDLDFSALLVALTLFTGIVWAIDHFAFRPKRLARDPKAKEPVLVEYCRSFFPVIAFVLVLRSFVAEPFRIPSDSMMPTLLDGDFILVSKFAYGIKLPVINRQIIEVGEPRRGDVVVFRYPGLGPDDPLRNQDYIKRVIGLPGDRIVVRDRRIFVNDEPVELRPVGPYEVESRTRDYRGYAVLEERLGEVSHRILLGRAPQFAGGPEGEWTVGPGEYFVMGDNRSNSQDSRIWGMVPERNLVGRAFFIWLSWDRRNGGLDLERMGTVIR